MMAARNGREEVLDAVVNQFCLGCVNARLHKTCGQLFVLGVSGKGKCFSVHLEWN
jgi:hypothetical protein